MIEYELIRSKRKTVSITVKSDGQVIVRAPLLASTRRINEFVESKEDWINKNVKRVLENPAPKPVEFTPEEKKRLVKQARILITQRVEYYAPIVGVSYNRIAIKDAKTRWGSCSRDGNLNFSFRLVLKPLELLDYVVVHELCHRIHMNHSKEFWQEVERILPDYKDRRKRLNKF
jgi:predicted metal-dependent hydrolase